MANKGPRIKIMMASTAKNKNGNPTGTAYYTYKNPRNETDGSKKLELKKYDRAAFDKETGKLGFRVAFKEKKVPK